jgi:hypothetical protein
VALTVPDVEELALHMRLTERFSATEEEWADDSLSRATDLMSIATGLTADPEDELTARLVRVGILAMAHMIYVTSGQDRSVFYNPYSSERIGSYSYSKAQQQVGSGQPTGVPEFDAAVRYVLSSAEEGGYFSSSSEEVFEGPFDAVEPVRQVPLVWDAWSR